MPRVVFTANLNRHVDCPDVVVHGNTVQQALETVFADHRALRNYVVDDQDRLRTHMVVFVDGQPIKDRDRLSDPVSEASEIYVMQALSGG